MAGAPNKNSNHIYLLYSKYGDNDFTHWKNAGPIFGYNALEDDQQWSGSATVNSDGSIQLYYTKNDTSGGKLNWQQLASATLNLAVENDEVVIKSVENDHILFGGDNYHYQSYPKFMSTFNDDHNHDGNPDRTDNYCLRDPTSLKITVAATLFSNQIQVTKTTKAKNKFTNGQTMEEMTPLTLSHSSILLIINTFTTLHHGQMVLSVS